MVCLQEVQADYFEQHINPFMNELGYDGLFKQKSRDFTGSYVKVSYSTFIGAVKNMCSLVHRFSHNFSLTV